MLRVTYSENNSSKSSAIQNQNTLNIETIQKIAVILFHFFTTWGLIAFVNYQLSNSCQENAMLREKYCSDKSILNNSTCSAIPFSYSCSANSFIEKIGGSFVTALGLTLFARSRSIKEFVIKYIHA